MSLAEDLASVLKSYGFLFAHFTQFLRLAVPWSLLAGVFAFTNEDLLTASDLFVLPVASTVVSVAWYRAILLKEEPWPLRGFGRREWRFLIASYIPIVFSLGFSCLVWIAWLWLEPKGAWPQDTSWLDGPIPVIVINLTWMLAVTPVLLAFPEIAVENRGLHLLRLIRTTRPVLFSSLIGIVAVSLPTLAADILTSTAYVSGFADSSHAVARAAVMTADTFVSFSSDVALAGFASHLYHAVRPQA